LVFITKKIVVRILILYSLVGEYQCLRGAMQQVYLECKPLTKLCLAQTRRSTVFTCSPSPPPWKP